MVIHAQARILAERAATNRFLPRQWPFSALAIRANDFPASTWMYMQPLKQTLQRHWLEMRPEMMENIVWLGCPSPGSR